MKFNQKKKEITVNLAGGKAIKHNPEMELIVGCLSTFLKDEFYESGSDRIKRMSELIQKVDPKFVSNLAIVARKEFYLRSITHVLVSELAKAHKGDSLVKDTIKKIAERPDDLIEIIVYSGKPLPNQIKKGVASALTKFSEYQLSKYKASKKNTKLVDLFNLTHPLAIDEKQDRMWGRLLKGELKCKDTWEARLSSGEDKAKVWKDLISNKKIGYMALLRNLRNISKQATKDTIKKACQMIIDEEQVKKSKQLPFRFYNAYENVENQDMLQAISDALEISLDNVPELSGKTLIAIDASGSMEGDPIKKASVFAGALMKSNNCDVILYDTEIKKFKYLKDEPVISLAEKIQDQAMGGGTETSLVFTYATHSQEKYKRIIILSDNESWSEGWRESSVQDAYKKYRKLNDCFIYAIDIQGNGTKDIDSPKVTHLCGWSERLLDFIKWGEQKDKLVDYIKNYKK